MGFWPSKRNSRSSTSPGGGGRSDQQSSVAPSQLAGFRISRFWRTSKSTNSLTPDSTLPLTGTQEENGNKGTLHNLVTNSPTEPPKQDPPVETVIQSPGIQLPAVNAETPTSQSHSVACHPSLQDDKSVNSTPPPPQPPSIWERTLDIAETILRDHGLPALDRTTLGSASSAENIQAVLETLKTAQGEDQKEKLIGKDRLQRILRGVEKYTKIVDTAVQHSPEVTALVWAGIRGILQVSVLLQVRINMNSEFMIYTGRFL